VSNRRKKIALLLPTDEIKISFVCWHAAFGCNKAKNQINLQSIFIHANLVSSTALEPSSARCIQQLDNWNEVTPVSRCIWLIQLGGGRSDLWQDAFRSADCHTGVMLGAKHSPTKLPCNQGSSTIELSSHGSELSASEWQEPCLCLCHTPGSTQPWYATTQLYKVAELVVFGNL